MEETLTVSVAIGSEVDIQSPRPAPLQDDSVLLEDGDGQQTEGDKREGTGDEDGTNVTGIPDRLHRFYFESDALVLKNNVELDTYLSTSTIDNYNYFSPSYQKLLKALALLEAQKMQATKVSNTAHHLL